ncbi:MAG: GntR family transcriptional regulator, partial [Sphingobium sp.]
MSPAHVLEPTYDTLRRRLLAGVWPSGQRLEAARLAKELGVSITPVRDSLNRLAGERLVHASRGEGYQVPLLDETELDRKSTRL